MSSKVAVPPETGLRRAGLSEALEDYLEIILALAARRPGVRVRDIAQAKGVRMPTVTAALKRLSALGFVTYQAREHVTLTSDGATIARRIAGRHRFLVLLLGKILGVTPAIARRDACGLEHHLSAESLERLTAFVEYIETCPEVGRRFLPRFRECFGRPTRRRVCQHPSCPQAARRAGGGRAPSRGDHQLVPVAGLASESTGEVARIQASELVRVRLQRRGLVPGVMLEIVRGGTQRRAALVRVAGQELRLEPHEARAIFLDTRSSGEAADA